MNPKSSQTIHSAMSHTQVNSRNENCVPKLISVTIMKIRNFLFQKQNRTEVLTISNTGPHTLHGIFHTPQQKTPLFDTGCGFLNSPSFLSPFSSVNVSPSCLSTKDFSSSSCMEIRRWLWVKSFWILSTDFSKSLWGTQRHCHTDVIRERKRRQGSELLSLSPKYRTGGVAP